MPYDHREGGGSRILWRKGLRRRYVDVTGSFSRFLTRGASLCAAAGDRWSRRAPMRAGTQPVRVCGNLRWSAAGGTSDATVASVAGAHKASSGQRRLIERLSTFTLVVISRSVDGRAWPCGPPTGVLEREHVVVRDIIRGGGGAPREAPSRCRPRASHRATAPRSCG